MLLSNAQCADAYRRCLSLIKSAFPSRNHAIIIIRTGELKMNIMVFFSSSSSSSVAYSHKDSFPNASISSYDLEGEAAADIFSRIALIDLSSENSESLFMVSSPDEKAAAEKSLDVFNGLSLIDFSSEDDSLINISSLDIQEEKIKKTTLDIFIGLSLIDLCLEDDSLLRTSPFCCFQNRKSSGSGSKHKFAASSRKSFSGSVSSPKRSSSGASCSTRKLPKTPSTGSLKTLRRRSDSRNANQSFTGSNLRTPHPITRNSEPRNSPECPSSAPKFSSPMPPPTSSRIPAAANAQQSYINPNYRMKNVKPSSQQMPYPRIGFLRTEKAFVDGFRNRQPFRFRHQSGQLRNPFEIGSHDRASYPIPRCSQPKDSRSLEQLSAVNCNSRPFRCSNQLSGYSTKTISSPQQPRRLHPHRIPLAPRVENHSGHLITVQDSSRPAKVADKERDNWSYKGTRCTKESHLREIVSCLMGQHGSEKVTSAVKYFMGEQENISESNHKSMLPPHQPISVH